MLPVKISYADWRFEGDLPQTLAEVALSRREPLVHALANMPAGRPTIARRLLRIPDKTWRRMPAHVQRQLATLTCDFGFGDSAEPLLTSFLHRGVIYHMPRRDGENLRAQEYALAEGMLQALIANPDDRTLFLLVATYAREADPDKERAAARNDIRIPLLSRDQVEARATALEGLAPGYTSMVVAYAAGVQKLIHELYADFLFGSDGDGDEEPRPGVLNLGWWGTFMRVAKQGTFGPLPQVHDAYLHDVCAYLAQEVSDAREAERRQRAQRPGG